MKNVLWFILLFSSLNVMAQTNAVNMTKEATTGKFAKILKQFSLTVSAGTGYYHNELAEVSKLTFGQLNLQFKTSPSFSIGFGSFGSILQDYSYYNNEGLLVSGCNDEDGVENGDPDNPNDPDNIEEQHQDGCNDGEFELVGDLLGNATYKLPGKLPLCLQFGGGYSRAAKAPVYTLMAGYNQKLFAGISLLAGVRYSNLISSRNYVSKTGGIKAELGLGWNF